MRHPYTGVTLRFTPACNLASLSGFLLKQGTTTLVENCRHKTPPHC